MWRGLPPLSPSTAFVAGPPYLFQCDDIEAGLWNAMLGLDSKWIQILNKASINDVWQFHCTIWHHSDDHRNQILRVCTEARSQKLDDNVFVSFVCSASFFTIESLQAVRDFAWNKNFDYKAPHYLSKLNNYFLKFDFNTLMLKGKFYPIFVGTCCQPATYVKWVAVQTQKRFLIRRSHSARCRPIRLSVTVPVLQFQ